jgi:hypothetical protein
MRLFFLFYRLLCMTCGRRRRPLFELHLHPTLQFNGVTFRWDGLKFVRETRVK